MRLPIEMIKTINHTAPAISLSLAQVNDKNWNYGMSKSFPGFLTFNLKEYRDALAKTDDIYLVIDNEERKLISIKEVGTYLYVMVDGKIIDKKLNSKIILIKRNIQ